MGQPATHRSDEDTAAKMGHPDADRGQVNYCGLQPLLFFWTQFLFDVAEAPPSALWWVSFRSARRLG
jgi:hypothetical protein